MDKVFLALQKAHKENNKEPLFNAQATELLLGAPMPTTPSPKTLPSSSPRAPQDARENHHEKKGHERMDECLVAFYDVKNSVAEQYRKLYVEIVRAEQERELRLLMISSALAEEGKTTTALNLAATIAASSGERKVLFVETDFRKPKVQKLLGIPSPVGLTDYLLGDIAYSRMFIQTEIPGLTVVHAGKQVKNPAVLLDSEKLQRFFWEIKAQNQYRYVILDSSPILLTSDPGALMQHVNAAILIVRAGKTPRSVVLQAIATLGAENILGCVFNGVTSTDSYYYHYYYSTEYYSSRSIESNS